LICERFGFVGEGRAQPARAAALPRVFPNNAHVRRNLGAVLLFRAHPELFTVPLRVLNRWASRSHREAHVGVMKGPVLVTWRRARVLS
jgi:hypothetical protein